jgi:acyl-CoA thioesterase I
MMHRRAFVAVLLVAGLLTACERLPKPTPLPSDATVVAFGDSVTYGTGAAAGEDWPSRLAALSGWTVINAGVPGETAEQARDRIDAVLTQYQPALVIIEIGGNDFLRRRPPEAVKADVRRITQSVRQQGAQAVLVAVPQVSLLGIVSGAKSDAPLYRELAREDGIPVVEKVFAEILSRPEWCADQIHPNAEGYRTMAATIYAFLAQTPQGR